MATYFIRRLRCVLALFLVACGGSLQKRFHRARWPLFGRFLIDVSSSFCIPCFSMGLMSQNGDDWGRRDADRPAPVEETTSSIGKFLGSLVFSLCCIAPTLIYVLMLLDLQPSFDFWADLRCRVFGHHSAGAVYLIGLSLLIADRSQWWRPSPRGDPVLRSPSCRWGSGRRRCWAGSPAAARIRWCSTVHPGADFSARDYRYGKSVFLFITTTRAFLFSR